MNLGEHIEEGITAYYREYFNPKSQAQYCLTFKTVKHEKRRFDEVETSWGNINSNDDIDRYLNGFIHKMEFYSKHVRCGKELFIVDKFDIYLSIYQLIYSLQKLASCHNIESCDFKYDIGDIDRIFDILKMKTDEYKEISLISACRD